MTDELLDFTGKVALVTGGSRGLGRQMVLALAQRGADVIIASRKLEGCEQVAEEVRAMGRKALPYGCHVGNWDDLAKLTDAAYAEFGKIDILINNAGIAMRRTPEELTEADVDDVLNVNVRGLLMLSVGLGDAFIERGGGSIVNISSVAGLIGPLGRVAYSASKGAVDAMTRALAADWGRHGIRVNSVAPGIITTDIWAESRANVPGLIEKMEAGVSLRRWGASEDVADVVLFLASDLSSYVTGETIAVDGGMAKVRGGGEPEYRS